MPLAIKSARMNNKQRKKFEKAKKNVEKSYEYLRPNYDRFNKFVQMTFVSTLTANEKMFLLSKNRPLMEFNILEPYISRLRGEFAKAQMDVKVGMKNGGEMNQNLPPQIKQQKEQQQTALLEFVEGHMRHVFHEMKVGGVEYDLLTKTLTGGYAVAKVWADYKDDRSFEQQIFVTPVFDPTLTGWDMLATKHDKSDGDYFWEAYPYSKDRFEKEYPDVNIQGLGASNAYGSIKWSYRSNQEEIILLVDYYYKKKIKKRLVKLSDGSVMLMNEYKELVKYYDDNMIMRQIPQIVDERMTTVDKICRYKMVGNHLLEEEETDLPCFPYVYIDGNSELIKGADNSAIQWMTRPYVYNAVAAQKLKNFAGQSLAYGMMKMIQSPFMASTDNLRGQDSEPWRNPQDANILTYNAFKDDDPNIPLQPPIPINPMPLPPEIMATFESADASVMNILGSFDPSMSKLSEGNMSGVAYREMATMSNASSKPYIESMIRGMQSIAESILMLIPMTHTTPMTMPVRDAQGRKTYVKINQQDGVPMTFRPERLDVSLEAGPSFTVQQNQATAALESMARAFPGFAEFMQAKGLPMIVDNLQDIRGGDELKLLADEFMQEMAQMRKAAKDQPNPEMMMVQTAQQQVQNEMQAAQLRAQTEDKRTQVKAMTDMANIEVQREKNQIEMVKAMATLASTESKTLMDKDSHEYEKLLRAIEISNQALQMDYDENEREFNRQLAKHEATKPEKASKE